MTVQTELEHTKFCYQIIITISKICHISRFLKLKDKIFRAFFASSEKKKGTFNYARGLHCPISAEIRTVDSQSNLRILL